MASELEQNRLETGYVRSNRKDGSTGDWRGLFIRGDDALAYGLYLKASLNQITDSFARAYMRELAELLLGVNEHNNPDVETQQVQFLGIEPSPPTSSENVK